MSSLTSNWLCFTANFFPAEILCHAVTLFDSPTIVVPKILLFDSFFVSVQFVFNLSGLYSFRPSFPCPRWLIARGCLCLLFKNLENKRSQISQSCWRYLQQDDKWFWCMIHCGGSKPFCLEGWLSIKALFVFTERLWKTCHLSLATTIPSKNWTKCVLFRTVWDHWPFLAFEELFIKKM